MVLPIGNALMSEAVLIVGALLVLFVIFKLGKAMIGLLANIILGFVSLFALNSFFGIAIPFSLPVIVVTALLGLPGVALIVLLKLLGIGI
ncbi:MAG: pro-sigmaK processing inhibitor BofA family protein [Candidatus Micrarchaeota archaeon]|nr:pro-sigmaK processing inhibitor BofA family protein [Candidatus Micrarchaeota archaeon]